MKLEFRLSAPQKIAGAGKILFRVFCEKSLIHCHFSLCCEMTFSVFSEIAISENTENLRMFKIAAKIGARF
ncbi:MAG: hypothetical protein J1E59_08510 [Treponema sp.]|nr:hypothetical protein [Treponema sp.]